MVLTEIHLRNFRNHANTNLVFGDGITALLGKNGQGKTNILEGISFLGLMKSFYASGDATVLQVGKEEFEIKGVFFAGSGPTHSVEVRYNKASGEKLVRVDRERPETLASVIGRFPVVVLSPEHGAITSGAPSERRKFLDIVLSQLSGAYLNDLLEYRRVLRQRNRLLTDARSGGSMSNGLVDAWTESIVTIGTRIICRRAQFLRDFRQYVLDAYRVLVNDGEEPAMEYAATVDSDGVAEQIRNRLTDALDQRQIEERRRGQTLVGPHRDDVVFRLNDMQMQQFASQGQHKSFLIALKVAEFFYMRDRIGEAPILLMDDVFSELDEFRAGNIQRLIREIGQVVITATDERVFHGGVGWDDHHRRVFVELGACRSA